MVFVYLGFNIMMMKDSIKWNDIVRILMLFDWSSVGW